MNTFFVTVWLREILQWIYGLVHNYGIAVIIFTVLIRTVLTPFEVKSRKGMRKMSEIQPKLNKLQQKYGDDKQRLQQKQAELMKKEHYNPMSGCLPMLLQVLRHARYRQYGADRAGLRLPEGRNPCV